MQLPTVPVSAALAIYAATFPAATLATLLEGDFCSVNQSILMYQGMHFTYERFFPLEYIKAVLSLNIRYPGLVNETTKIEEIIEFYNVCISLIHRSFHSYLLSILLSYLIFRVKA
jgi:hypothetical protein